MSASPPSQWRCFVVCESAASLSGSVSASEPTPLLRLLLCGVPCWPSITSVPGSGGWTTRFYIGNLPALRSSRLQSRDTRVCLTSLHSLLWSPGLRFCFLDLCPKLRQLQWAGVAPHFRAVSSRHALGLPLYLLTLSPGVEETTESWWV